MNENKRKQREKWEDGPGYPVLGSACFFGFNHCRFTVDFGVLLQLCSSSFHTCVVSWNINNMSSIFDLDFQPSVTPGGGNTEEHWHNVAGSAVPGGKQGEAEGNDREGRERGGSSWEMLFFPVRPNVRFHCPINSSPVDTSEECQFTLNLEHCGDVIPLMKGVLTASKLLPFSSHCHIKPASRLMFCAKSELWAAPPLPLPPHTITSSLP